MEDGLGPLGANMGKDNIRELVEHPGFKLMQTVIFGLFQVIIGILLWVALSFMAESKVDRANIHAELKEHEVKQATTESDNKKDIQYIVKAVDAISHKLEREDRRDHRQ